ncbi:MAG: hypothetical protein HC936_05535 [Leptolyngbyaceae cyanobacterium SU_3_3]|nr:hypothetical protein [Leptolyngbyaceae cyanobacterium SU_3_3]
MLQSLELDLRFQAFVGLEAQAVVVAQSELVPDFPTENVVVDILPIE